MTEEKNINENYLTLDKAARHARVTRQAIYTAVRLKKIRAHKDHRGRWLVSFEDLDGYRANKYNPDKKKVDGENIYDFDRGYFSVQHVARILSEKLQRPYDIQHVYYLLRTGDLTGYRKGNSWVIKKEDAVALYEKELNSVQWGNMDKLRYAS